MAEENPTFFTIRVPSSVVDANGQRIECYQEIRYRSHRGNDAQMHPAEYAACCDLMLDKTIRWTAKNAETSARIDRQAILYRWWQAFIEFALGQVPIGSDEFRQSRAGLIHPTHLSSIRKAANLSPADFKALSLAEVFAVIEDIHCREHNEENRRQQQVTNKADADEHVPPAEYVSFKKKFLQWVFDRTDKALLSRVEEFGIKIHPDDVDTPRHSMRLELSSLKGTDLHDEHKRAAKLKEFQVRKK